MASPIFDDNDKKIGYAFKCEKKMLDYSPYIINRKYENMLKLYYYYISLNSLTFIQTKKFYYLINSDYMNKIKNYYDFSIFNKDFTQINLFNETAQKIKKNPIKFNNILNDRIITLIITLK